MGLDELTRHDHSSGTEGGGVLDIAEKLDVPTYSDDSNVPNGSFFFNDQDNDFKFKDDAGAVVTVTEQVIPTQIDVTDFGVGTLQDGQVLARSGSTLSGQDKASAPHGNTAHVVNYAATDAPVTDFDVGSLDDGEFLQNSGGSLAGGSPSGGGAQSNTIYSVGQWMLAVGGYYGDVYPGSTISGTATGTISGRGTEISSFSIPAAIQEVSIDPSDGTLWSAMGSNGWVHAERDGTQIDTFGRVEETHTGISVDPADGTLWISEGQSAEILHLDRQDSSQIGSFSAPSDQPTGVAVDPADGSLWTADSGTGTIYHLHRNGTEIQSFSPDGPPLGISVDPADGTLWATDSSNGGIFHYQRDGTFIVSFSSPMGLDVTGVAVDPADGSLWACGEIGNTVHINRFSGDTNTVEYGGDTFVRQRRPSNPSPQWNRDRFLRQPIATAATTVSRQSVVQPVDTSSSAVTVTLASAIVDDGAWVTVSDEGGNAGTNTITIDTEGSETIDGSASATIPANYGSSMFYSDGTNWYEG